MDERQKRGRRASKVTACTTRRIVGQAAHSMAVMMST
jgi:hypothetical protein